MPEDSRTLVFVYGTLRRGGSNACRMEGAEFVGAASVEGKLYTITWYPGLVLAPGAGRVAGELYRVGPEQLAALDEFEGVSAHEVSGAEYQRAEALVTTTSPSSATWWAQVYAWMGPVEESRWIPSGDWLDVEPLL